MNKFTAACLQYTATADWRRDLAEAFDLARQAQARGATLVALPEFCAGLASHEGSFAPVAEPEDRHPILASLTAFAREASLDLLAGSIGVRAPDGRLFNRSFMIDSQGRVVGRYDKIHLFDIDLGNDGGSYHESALIAPGAQATLAPTHCGLLGMSVCYDLRFPNLYRDYAQAGAAVLAVPAAFVATTGEAHWHTLLRARAIETGAYVIAPGQCGSNSDVSFYGHSLIVDPWGQVLADAGDSAGFITAEIDPARVLEARARIPAWNIRRDYASPRPSS